jgi:DNA-binding transcriptional ArsR family regulator
MNAKHAIAADVERHRALGHPVRQQILAALAGGRVATPKELAAELGLPVARTSYHISVLRDKDALKLVRTEPARGSVRHFYRATIDLSELSSSGSAKKSGLRSELEQVVQRADSQRGGGQSVDARSQLEWSTLELDQKGQEEVEALLAETTEAIEALKKRVEKRLKRSKSARDEAELTELAVLRVTRPASKRRRKKT